LGTSFNRLLPGKFLGELSAPSFLCAQAQPAKTPTPAVGQWHAVKVKRVLARADHVGLSLS
jgi:hypothetical protein